MAAHRITHMLALVALGALAACSDAERNEPDEPPDEVAVVVGTQGGKVVAKGVALEIPPGALDQELTITVKKTDKAAPTAVEKLSNVYEFGPEGTTFIKDVKVAFDIEKNEAKAVVYFTKKGSAVEFEELPTTRKDKQVTAAVNHFSLGFAGLPAADDLPERDASTEDSPDASADDLDAGAMLPDTGVVERPDADAGPVPMPGAQRVRVISTDWYGRPASQTWAAYRDGDGAWQALTPASEGEYQFDVREATYAAAFVCGNGEMGSEGVVILAPATHTTQRVEASELCVTALPLQHTVSGTVSASDTAFAWGHPFGSGVAVLPVGGPPPTYTMENFPAGVTVDPVVAVLDANSFITKAIILRDLTLTDNHTLALDFTNQGYTAMTAQFSVSGASLDTDLTVQLATKNANKGLSLGWGSVGGTTTRTLQYQYLVNPSLMPADNYVFEASEESAQDTRWGRLRTKMTGTVDFQLPLPFSVLFLREGSAHVLPKMQFDSVSDAVRYRLTVSETEGPVRAFSVQAHPEWLASQGPPPGGQQPEHELTLPDLTSAPGFDTNWLHPANSTVYFTGAVLRSTNALGGVLESYSGHTETSSIPY